MANEQCGLCLNLIVNKVRNEYNDIVTVHLCKKSRKQVKYSDNCHTDEYTKNVGLVDLLAANSKLELYYKTKTELYNEWNDIAKKKDIKRKS